MVSPLISGQIGSLQATQMTHEAAIRDLESEKSRLKDKVLRLEEERAALQNKSQALDGRQRQQILTLEKVPSKPHPITYKRSAQRPPQEDDLLPSRALELSVVSRLHKEKYMQSSEGCFHPFSSESVFLQIFLQHYYSAIAYCYLALRKYSPIKMD